MFTPTTCTRTVVGIGSKYKNMCMFSKKKSSCERLITPGIFTSMLRFVAFEYYLVDLIIKLRCHLKQNITILAQIVSQNVCLHWATNVDPALCHHVTSLANNELNITSTHLSLNKHLYSPPEGPGHHGWLMAWFRIGFLDLIKEYNWPICFI